LKIAVYSDLHLEFNKDLKLNVADEVEVIVLAGDIVVGKDSKFITDLCSQYPDKEVVYVSGNHEHYNQTISDVLMYYRDLSNNTPNLHFLNDSIVEIKSVVFHGTTLWTGFNSKGEAWRNIGKLEAERNISDFYRIKVRGSKMSADIMEGLHKQACHWLYTSLQKHSGRTNVVVTHWPPLIECKHPEIASSLFDTYFNNDLQDLISECNIDLWCYGHNHWSDEFELYDTRFISNQLGYPREKTGFTKNDYVVV